MKKKGTLRTHLFSAAIIRYIPFVLFLTEETPHPGKPRTI